MVLLPTCILPKMATDSSTLMSLGMKVAMNWVTFISGEGSKASACLKLQVVESFLPSGIWMYGPPENDTDSLAASTIKSAHETTSGHSSSTLDFITLIISLFLIPKFLDDLISDLVELSSLGWLESSSSNIEASHPWINNKHI